MVWRNITAATSSVRKVFAYALCALSKGGAFIMLLSGVLLKLGGKPQFIITRTAVAHRHSFHFFACQMNISHPSATLSWWVRTLGRHVPDEILPFDWICRHIMMQAYCVGRQMANAWVAVLHIVWVLALSYVCIIILQYECVCFQVYWFTY